MRKTRRILLWRLTSVMLGAALSIPNVVSRPATASTLSHPAIVDGRGPYNLSILQGGIGVRFPLIDAAAAVAGTGGWSLIGWVMPDQIQRGVVPIVTIGEPTSGGRTLAIEDGNLVFRQGNAVIRSNATIALGRWTAVGVRSDGRRVALFVDGHEVAAGTVSPNIVAASIAVAPTSLDHPHFGGRVAQLMLVPGAMTPAEFADDARRRIQPDLIVFDKPGQGWEWQEKQWRGLFQPQDPATLPTGNTPPASPIAVPPVDTAPLTMLGTGRWQMGGWRLGIGPDVIATGQTISTGRFDAAAWLPATVPGTVLTTLVDRGVYPDPSYGLNNLAIPEKLGRQDYWYRTTFDLPQAPAGARHHLLFNGINYAAEIWVNGTLAGHVSGAFIRGDLDVTALLHSGGNVVAVHILPPPHPGIAHEESIAAGPGNNGGQMTIDGPTFVATEGWDWIPGVRDRDIGLWQRVELRETGLVRIGDPQVVTKLPLPSTASARVTITVPIVNDGATPVAAIVKAHFGDVTVSQRVLAPPGASEVRFLPDSYSALAITAPKLWWPNGYGLQNLYTLDVTASVDGRASDAKTIRFGVREITYGLSLFDTKGELRRVEIDPTLAHERGEVLVALAHRDIKQTPDGWTESLTAAGETSPAARAIPTKMRSPHLTIFVNGVPIAARGGNWGMDDFMKRVSRERLEPYFRLHKEANIDIIRNWVGQNTEDVFYDLADEYGMLVLNDFWESTQDYQNEAEDPQLFLANAADVISRYRNHPSIAVWFGRNEGVPQPIINEGLDSLVLKLDGTRYYTGSSNRIGLQDSGPYKWQDPAGYFTNLDAGFSVEDGTPSLATLEAIKAMIPPADRWPISDTLVYHDWHIGGNGDVRGFMRVLGAQLGEPTSLEDFERKAQMLNYVDYRAIFEGFNAHLWTRNSGRLLWMSHPAWPSNHWQMYSADYDTAAAYYGVKAALEPVHIQLNLPDYALAVVNTSRFEASGLTLKARVTDIAGKSLLEHQQLVTAPANQTTTLAPLPIQTLIDDHQLVLVELTLSNADGVISRNLYWQGKNDAAYRLLNTLPDQLLQATASKASDGVVVEIANNTSYPILAVKLTLVTSTGERVLPAFYDDNYLNLMPGDRRLITIRAMKAPGAVGLPSAVQLRGWNSRPSSVNIK